MSDYPLPALHKSGSVHGGTPFLWVPWLTDKEAKVTAFIPYKVTAFFPYKVTAFILTRYTLRCVMVDRRGYG